MVTRKTLPQVREGCVKRLAGIGRPDQPSFHRPKTEEFNPWAWYMPI